MEVQGARDIFGIDDFYIGEVGIKGGVEIIEAGPAQHQSIQVCAPIEGLKLSEGRQRSEKVTDGIVAASGVDGVGATASRDVVVAASSGDGVVACKRVERIANGILQVGHRATGESYEGTVCRIGRVVTVRAVKGCHHTCIGHLPGWCERHECLPPTGLRIEFPASSFIQRADEFRRCRHRRAARMRQRLEEQLTTLTLCSTAGP